MNNINIKSLSAIALVMFLGVLIYTNGDREAYKAELKYVERSNSSKIVGGVMPASCESYQFAPGNPEEFVAHTPEDTDGHCAGTCPADMKLNYNVPYKKCRYEQTFTETQGGGSFTLYGGKVVGLGASCPDHLAITGPDLQGRSVNYVRADPYAVPVCVVSEAKICLEFEAGCVSCPNGAINPGPSKCDECGYGKFYSGGSCIGCGSDGNGCRGVPAKCNNGAMNEPVCYGSCRPNFYWDNGQNKCLEVEAGGIRL